MKKLIITLDVDNDFIREPLEKEQSLQWDGLKVGMPEILLAIDGLALRLNTQIAVTIFCRADWQIEAVMGEVSWVFKKTQDVLKSLDLKNIQIGLEWHPHLYEKQNGKWALSVNKYAQEKQLLDIYAKLNNAGFDVKCSRMQSALFSTLQHSQAEISVIQIGQIHPHTHISLHWKILQLTGIPNYLRYLSL